MERKIKAIEYLDERVIKKVKEGMDASGEDYRILVLPDHPTPIALRTHTSDPVPFLLYDNRANGSRMWHYNEREAAASGLVMPSGAALMEYFLDENTLYN